MYYDHSACMYYDPGTCMYYDPGTCMYYDHSTRIYLRTVPTMEAQTEEQEQRGTISHAHTQQPTRELDDRGDAHCACRKKQFQNGHAILK